MFYNLTFLPSLPSEYSEGIDYLTRKWNLFSTQVWCLESDKQQYQNWTVDSGQHSLDITALKPGKHYWLTIAAVNGAGVGLQSDPHGFIISEHF